MDTTTMYICRINKLSCTFIQEELQNNTPTFSGFIYKCPSYDKNFSLAYYSYNTAK
jgi:hypothetical protein